GGERGGVRVCWGGGGGVGGGGGPFGARQGPVKARGATIHSGGDERWGVWGAISGPPTQLERPTGFEPATSSLGSWHSATELRPPSAPYITPNTRTQSLARDQREKPAHAAAPRARVGRVRPVFRAMRR